MTIHYTDAKVIKELYHKGGIENVRDLETLSLESLSRLEDRLLIARLDDKVILTDIGMELAALVKGAL